MSLSVSWPQPWIACVAPIMHFTQQCCYPSSAHAPAPYNDENHTQSLIIVDAGSHSG